MYVSVHMICHCFLKENLFAYRSVTYTDYRSGGILVMFQGVGVAEFFLVYLARPSNPTKLQREH